jgi:transposase InsO family protein
VECLPDSTDNGIAISMDGKGASRDNVFVERLWRSVEYEDRRRIWSLLHGVHRGAVEGELLMTVRMTTPRPMNWRNGIKATALAPG